MSAPCTEDLAFFGEVTAGVTHELKNVLSILNESAGLLGDLCLATNRGRPLDPRRVASLAGDLARSVERGVAIVSTLNRFAHCADAAGAASALDLRVPLRDAITLAGRLAATRGTRIDLAAPAEPVTVVVPAFAAHHLLGLALRIAVLDCEAPQPVKVELATQAAAAARVTITRAGLRASPAVAARTSSLRSLCDRAGWQVNEAAPGADELSLVLTIPAVSARAG